jgi:photosystem II stability/assembly factor-like uncharacterized protein
MRNCEETVDFTTPHSYHTDRAVGVRAETAEKGAEVFDHAGRKRFRLEGRIPTRIAAGLMAVFSSVFGVALVGSASPASAALSGTTPVWSVVATGPSKTAIIDLSCPSTSHCVAVGEDSTTKAALVLVSTDGGTSWKTVSTLPQYLHNLLSVSCASTTHCVAVGEFTTPSGVTPGTKLAIIYTTNGGTSWTGGTLTGTLPTPPGTRIGPDIGFTDVSCGSTSSCVAMSGLIAAAPTSYELQTHIFQTTDGGAKWKDIDPTFTAYKGVYHDPTFASGNALDCMSATRCVAVGGFGPSSAASILTTNGGRTWTAVGMPSAAPLPTGDTAAGNAITCPSASVCYAVGAAGKGKGLFTSSTVIPLAWKSTNGGASWQGVSISSVASSGGLLSVSCPSTASCTAVGNGLTLTGTVGPELFLSTSNGGTTWASEPVTNPAAETYLPETVHCTSGTSCLSGGLNASTQSPKTETSWKWAVAKFPTYPTTTSPCTLCPPIPIVYQVCKFLSSL